MTFKSKYKIGQEVWVMRSNVPTCRKVSVIIITQYDHRENPTINYVMSQDSGEKYYETDVHPTKSKLIKSLQ